MRRLASVLAVSLVALGPVRAGPSRGGSRGYVALPPAAFAAHAADISPLIYVNRCPGGCVFTKAAVSDAITNRTVVGAVPNGTVMTVTEFAHSEDVWNQTIACLRSVYQPFDVQVVTEDPGPVPHHEAVLAGRASDLHIAAGGVLGIAPIDLTCQPHDNVISFAFANDQAASPLDLCWTVAQETAHAYGLDHAYECSDAMTYLPIDAQCPGAKMFRNVDAPCGAAAPMACLCGGATQNSYQRLLAVHGPGPTPVAAPTVDLSMPTNDQAGLPRGFSVIFTAIDPRGLHHSELLVNGWRWLELPGTWQKTSPYVMSVPMSASRSSARSSTASPCAARPA